MERGGSSSSRTVVRPSVRHSSLIVCHTIDHVENLALRPLCFVPESFAERDYFPRSLRRRSKLGGKIEKRSPNTGGVLSVEKYKIENRKSNL